ncbi:hypothetical protein Pmani_027168 [Petrolisthes manimaculis]|uniref:Uncharacterized protein n=1 Tax=Petrolisthes manimaculis TaxID=1843537 RepID=A0AAE1TX45_9EUCA|nr:hypothetical protein Pmani_027168 [Petrolisthes manimaculis]
MGPKIAYIAAETMKRKEMEEVEETEKRSRKGEETEDRNREGKKRKEERNRREEMKEAATTNTTTTTTIANTTTTTCVSVGVGTDNVGHHSTFDAAGTADQTTSPHTTAPTEDHPVSPTRRICRVCGDRAKSMHFGGLSCDSCKAFFRRAVHNDAHTNFSCPYDEFCIMNITSRKCCQFCRYKKCLSIGMEPRWVMSEEERKHRLRQRADKRTKVGGEEDGKGALRDHKRGLVPHEPDPATLLHYMTTEERDEVEQAVRNYQLSYTDVPYLSDLLSGWKEGRPSVQIVAMFTTIIKRFAYFARLFPAFLDFTSHDQETLLRTGILEMSLIRGVQTFDTSNNRWPDSSHLLYHSAPTLKAEDMKKLVSCELYETYMKFIHSLNKLGVDEPVMMMLLLIVLFTSDRPGLKDTAAVQIKQDHYLLLLRKYLGWRHGPHNARLLYPRLLLKLTDLRELNDQHNNYNLKLAKREIKEIQTQLGEQEAAQSTTWSTDQHHHNLSSFVTSTVRLGNSPSSPKLFVKSDHSLPSGNNYVANVIQTGQCLPEMMQEGASNTTLASGRAQTVVTSNTPNVQPQPPNKGFYTSLNADLASVLISLDLEEELTSDPNFLRLLIQHIKQSFLAATTSRDMNNKCPLIDEQTLHTMVQKYQNQDMPQEQQKHTLQQHNPGHQQYQQPEQHKLQQYQQQHQMHQQKHQQHPLSIPNEATVGKQDTNTQNPQFAHFQTQQQYDLHMRLQQQNPAFLTEYSLLEQQRRRRQQQEDEIKSALLMVKAEYDLLNPTSTNDSQFMLCEDQHNKVYHNISNSTNNYDYQDSQNYFMQQQSPDTQQPIPPHSWQHTSHHSWQQTPPHSLQQTPPHTLQHTPPHGLQHTSPHSLQQTPPHCLQQTPIEQSPWETTQHNSSIVFQQGVQGPDKCLYHEQAQGPLPSPPPSQTLHQIPDQQTLHNSTPQYCPPSPSLHTLYSSSPQQHSNSPPPLNSLLTQFNNNTNNNNSPSPSLQTFNPISPPSPELPTLYHSPPSTLQATPTQHHHHHLHNSPPSQEVFHLPPPLPHHSSSPQHSLLQSHHLSPSPKSSQVFSHSPPSSSYSYQYSPPHHQSPPPPPPHLNHHQLPSPKLLPHQHPYEPHSPPLPPPPPPPCPQQHQSPPAPHHHTPPSQPHQLSPQSSMYSPANQFIRSKLDGVEMSEEEQVGRRGTEGMSTTLPTSCTDSMPLVCHVMDLL